jgi:hypothetical protein
VLKRTKTRPRGLWAHFGAFWGRPQKLVGNTQYHQLFLPVNLAGALPAGGLCESVCFSVRHALRSAIADTQPLATMLGAGLGNPCATSLSGYSPTPVPFFFQACGALSLNWQQRMAARRVQKPSFSWFSRWARNQSPTCTSRSSIALRGSPCCQVADAALYCHKVGSVRLLARKS